ncbi:hypothetical protein ACX3VG_13495, partial [Escherichia coli]
SWLGIIAVYRGGQLRSSGYPPFQAEAGIRDDVESRGLGDVYKRQRWCCWPLSFRPEAISSPSLKI